MAQESAWAVVPEEAAWTKVDEPKKEQPAQPTFFDTHPKTRQVVKGTLDTLPAVGGMIGGVLATPETLGTGTILGGALGVGAGRGLRDLAAQAIGLEQSSPAEKAFNIGVDTGVAAITPGIYEMASSPLRNIKDFGEIGLSLMPTRLRDALTKAAVLGTPKVAQQAATLTRPYWQTLQPEIAEATKEVAPAAKAEVEALIAKLPRLANNPPARKAVETAIRAKGGTVPAEDALAKFAEMMKAKGAFIGEGIRK